MEWVLAMTLLAILVAITAPMLALLLDGYLLAKASAAASSEATLAMTRMVNELRTADINTIQISQGTVAFQNENGATRLQQSAGNDPGIRMQQQGSEEVLAHVAGSNSLRFTRLSNNLLAISFTVTIPLAAGTPILQPWTTAVFLSGQ
ncbi:MAG: hypothetical protein HQM06_12915 [Magnetococcales bacterium]|nr:hypothetical protein [Magnetococcales bacterium]